jgi:dienelactone hydrolase
VKQIFRFLNAYKVLRATPVVDDDFSEMMHKSDSAAMALNHLVEPFPFVVCLCGSTRFKEEFEAVNKTLTEQGYIVLTVGSFGHHGTPLDEKLKERLDGLHMNKIAISDFVYIINKDGYVGESTKREIAYAASLNKTIQYLE